MRGSLSNLSTLVGAVMVLTPSAAAQVQFVDQAAELGLDYTTLRGPELPGSGAIFQAIIHRNLGHGAAVGDYDNDGDLDVYLLGSLGQPNALFRNDLDTGLPGFTDVTAQAGNALADTGLSRVAHFVDLDNDGLLDIVLINDDDGNVPESKTFRNNGGGAFDDLPLPIPGYAKGGASLADYDHDGYLDLYVSNWGLEVATANPSWPGLNQLLRNNGAFGFTDTTIDAGLGVIARDSFTSIFTDFDDNGFTDLFVAIDHTADEFYTCENGLFSLVSDSVGIHHTGNDMGVACADIDDDGDLDLFVSNITDVDPPCFFGTTQGNALHINQLDTGQLRFEDHAAARGVFNTYWGWGAEFIDVDNDTDLDLVVGTGFDEFVNHVRGETCDLLQTPTLLFINDGTANFRLRPLDVLNLGDDTRTVIAFDFDRDGDRDFLTTSMQGPVRLYENRTPIDPQNDNWLTVRVRQREGLNTFGIGVRIDAFIGEQTGTPRTLRRDILAGRSYLAGVPPEAHFGLGAHDKIDFLRVHWTDGAVTILPDVGTNRVLDIAQPECPCERDDVTQITLADLLLFLEAWFDGSVLADIDASNDTDIVDLLRFLDCWIPASLGADCH